MARRGASHRTDLDTKSDTDRRTFDFAQRAYQPREWRVIAENASSTPTQEAEREQQTAGRI